MPLNITKLLKKCEIIDLTSFKILVLNNIESAATPLEDFFLVIENSSKPFKNLRQALLYKKTIPVQRLARLLCRHR